MRIIIFAFVLAITLPAKGQSNQDARNLYEKMMTAMSKVQTCTYTLTFEERIYGKFYPGKLKVKLNVNPYKVYAYSVKPDEGAEVLYFASENNGKVLINPNKFPYINVSLSPLNSIFRKNHQFTILQMGFDYLHGVLKENERTQKENFFSKLSIKQDAAAEDKPYYILEIDNNEFGFINYRVMKGEDVTSISKKFFINDQMILELNRDVKYFDDVSPGQVLTLPNSFARKIIFYVDKKTMLPLTQILYDHKGLYSKIEFGSFQLNPVFAPNEFSRNNPKYQF
jgi:hypothetical protein